jgi:hypothetical protein
MSIIRKLLMEKIADHRVLGILAILSFASGVVKATMDARSQGGAENRNQLVSVETTEGQANYSYSGEELSQGASMEPLDIKLLHSSRSRPPPRVPGDFFSDLSAAFEKGGASGLVHLPTATDETTFEKWRAAPGMDTSLQGITLRRLKAPPGGVEEYDITFDKAAIRGRIILKQADQRWHVVGARKQVESSGEEKSAQMIDVIKRSRK